MFAYRHIRMYCYGVASISRFLKVVGLFCRIQSLLQGSFAKETGNCKEATNRRHSIHSAQTSIGMSTVSVSGMLTVCVSVVSSRVSILYVGGVTSKFRLKCLRAYIRVMSLCRTSTRLEVKFHVCIYLYVFTYLVYRFLSPALSLAFVSPLIYTSHQPYETLNPQP